MDAKFHRTASVFAGWTMHHPRQPPRPEVEKMIALDRGGGGVDDDVVVVIGDVAKIDDLGGGWIMILFFSFDYIQVLL